MTSPAEELRRLLSRLPREEPPDIPLEQLLSRMAAARRRTIAAVSAVFAAGLIAALTVRSVPDEPPVYLDLRVVNVDPGEEVAGRPGPSADAPAEFEKP